MHKTLCNPGTRRGPPLHWRRGDTSQSIPICFRGSPSRYVRAPDRRLRLRNFDDLRLETDLSRLLSFLFANSSFSNSSPPTFLGPFIDSVGVAVLDCNLLPSSTLRHVFLSRGCTAHGVILFRSHRMPRAFRAASPIVPMEETVPRSIIVPWPVAAYTVALGRYGSASGRCERVLTGTVVSWLPGVPGYGELCVQ